MHKLSPSPRPYWSLPAVAQQPLTLPSPPTALADCYYSPPLISLHACPLQTHFSLVNVYITPIHRTILIY